LTQKTWLAADYHLPITYSCAMPLSSPHSAQCLPAPGSTTVKLAFIRNSIELFGLAQTRDILFPVIQDLEVMIRPPTQVAISSQTLLSYKVNEKDNQISLVESIGYREFAHAYDALTIFVLVPVIMQDQFIELLHAVGYWGQASSLAFCQRVYEAEPPVQETIQPLSTIADLALGDRFAAFLTHWKKQDATWDMVIGVESTIFLEPMLYIFPLEVCEWHSGGHLLVLRSLEVGSNSPG
jgi:hypothetical protein